MVVYFFFFQSLYLAPIIRQMNKKLCAPRLLGNFFFPSPQGREVQTSSDHTLASGQADLRLSSSPKKTPGATQPLFISHGESSARTLSQGYFMVPSPCWQWFWSQFPQGPLLAVPGRTEPVPEPAGEGGGEGSSSTSLPLFPLLIWALGSFTSTKTPWKCNSDYCPLLRF